MGCAPPAVRADEETSSPPKRWPWFDMEAEDGFVYPNGQLYSIAVGGKS